MVEKAEKLILTQSENVPFGKVPQHRRRELKNLCPVKYS
jgi:hypothetical protein